MKLSFPIRALALATLTLAAHEHAFAAAGRTQRGERTALDRYIAKPDTNYSFRIASSIKGDGLTIHYIDMISQSWLTTNEVNRPLWQHWLTIVVPDKVTNPTALLFINGGANKTKIGRAHV